ncbi:MAG: MmgE/PrpD family protein [Pigmentiphaga sp.]
MQTTRQMANYVCQTGYADMDRIVIDRVKDICLSALGSAVAGSRMDVSRLLADYVGQSGAPREASLIGFGTGTSAELAAFVNCSASHCTELEDVAFPEAAYTCHIVPSMFALGEKLGASGRAILEAIVLGYEITARPAMTSKAFSRGWQATAHFGTIGAAAGAGKLLGLNEAQMTHALSIAASFAGGVGRQTGSGAHVIEAGAAGRNGILAATLAAAGLTGTPTIMEGKAGYWDAVGGNGELDFVLGKGTDFRVMQVGFKAYPCCYFLQRIIDGVKQLVAEHRILPHEVDAVEVEVNALFQRIVPHEHPRDGEEARFSLNHAVAAALAGDDVFVETFTVQSVQDPRLAALRPKVKMLRHADWDGGVMESDNPLVIRMTDGRQFAKRCLTHHGDPKDPLDRQEVIARFDRCARGVLSAQVRGEVAALVYELDELADVRGLMQRLAAMETVDAR